MKKLTALFLVFALTLVFAACGSKNAPETTAAPEESTEEITEAEVTEEVTEAAEEITEETAEWTSEEASEEETSAEAEKLALPATKAEMLEMYNSAVNNAYDKKAGFSKERYTDNASFDMSLALKAFKSLVEKFVGIGDENRYSEKVTKGNWDSDAKKAFLRKSTLTEADLTDASVKEEGGYYVITLNIKGGDSVGSKGEKRTNAPVDKCGICVGNEDKGYYDHKTGEVIYDAIAGTYEGASIKENYKNAKAVAKVDPATGELVALTVTFDISVAIDISIGSGTASGTTHVIYKDFKY